LSVFRLSAQSTKQEHGSGGDASRQKRSAKPKPDIASCRSFYSFQQKEWTAVQDAAKDTPGTGAEDELEREADAAIALCDGDVRAALKAALVANAFLLAEITKTVSLGFTRGRTPAQRASERLDRWREISCGLSQTFGD
jgi:hypothetical protein